MKKSILVALSITLFSLVSMAQEINPVLITIDGKEIRKNEFLSIYTQNNNEPKFDKASMDDYLDIFVKYKLKVFEAEEMGFDTIKRLKNELNGYVNKSAEKYLSDSEATESLIQEAYERKKYEIKASHILITKGGDTYKKALEIRAEIIKSGDFEAAAAKYSQDPSVKDNKGSLGYFTVFQMLYLFEEAAYTTKVGDISMPVKTKFGHHLIKVYDKRKNKGRVKVAHIYSKIPKEGDENAKENARVKIEEIYSLVKAKNKSFEDFAREYSDDNTSAQKGGELDWFTSGRMVPEFEDVAFSLKNKGDISEPFLTSYGWHIIKMLELEEIGTYEKLKPEIENNISRGERSKKSTEFFVNKLKKEYRFKDKSKRWIKNSYNPKVESKLDINDSKIAFKFKKEEGFFKKYTKVTVSDFKDFLSKIPANSQQDIEAFYKDYTNSYIFQYEKSILYDKYPDYKALMQQFKDGILLFEISDQKVWNKSSKDTTGLKEFFSMKQKKYQWKARQDVEIYTSAKKDVIFEANKMAKDKNVTSLEIMNNLNKTSRLNLSLEQGKYEVEEKKILEKFPPTLGVSQPVIENGKFVFVRIKALIPSGNKELKDTRGAVISDYQVYLEEEWIKSLKAKYNVVINKEAVYSLGK
ncbi:MAG: peptidyl-prolyl cis-trans isomerase SurA [Urechidicola sp.]|jgi:peptidyl-prolyl cis-trans isomerase SurA|tara:strand:- start:6253 stop:8166 length:1914 start_codon:yes stop_codon:yes gene_type:complete